MMSDLRESGSLEQDADMVILLHRDDVYEKESTRPGEADLIVAKHRNGPTRDITVAFQGHYSRFVDMGRWGDGETGGEGVRGTERKGCGERHRYRQRWCGLPAALSWMGVGHYIGPDRLGATRMAGGGGGGRAASRRAAAIVSSSSSGLPRSSQPPPLAR